MESATDKEKEILLKIKQNIIELSFNHLAWNLLMEKYFNEDHDFVGETDQVYVFRKVHSKLTKR